MHAIPALSRYQQAPHFPQQLWRPLVNCIPTCPTHGHEGEQHKENFCEFLN